MPARVAARNEQAIAAGAADDVRLCFQTLYCYAVLFGPAAAATAAAAADEQVASLTRDALTATLAGVEHEFALRYGADAAPARYAAFAAGALKLLGLDAADAPAVGIAPRAAHDVVVDTLARSADDVAAAVAAVVQARAAAPQSSRFLANKAAAHARRLFFER